MNDVRTVVVSLGSNLGDSASLLEAAIQALTAVSPRPVRRSSFWRSTPVDCPEGSADFLNAVVVMEPLDGETPERLLDRLQALEQAFGRVRKSIRNEPRALDLDLICFGDEVRQDGRLVLPHPRAHLRRFVLAPLCEVVPELVFPGQLKTVRQLLAELPPGQEVERRPADSPGEESARSDA